MLDLLLLCVTGVATGFLNVMAGGGSMLSVPIMIFLGVPGTIANGTNRIAILPQNISAVWAFYRKGFSNFKLSLSLGLCTIPGTLIGATLAARVPSDQFNTLLALIMVLVLIIMALPQPKTLNPAESPSKNRLIAGHIIMILIGFWGGFIHIGVGFLLMPTLNRVMQLDLITTNAHKVFIVMCYTVVALVVFAAELELIWKYGIALGIGTWIGAWLAANMQVKKGIGPIKITLNIVIMAFIIKLLFF
ncbi:MAG: sulfite exporter TauE/SafE family protein [Gammaproteobacteria bacterium]|nr:sulfite exporter TauE/SafE family protein [Gammaproteobacteria bacterium]